METQQLEQWNAYMDVDTGVYLGEGIFLSREYVEKKQEAQVNKAEGFAKKKKKDEFAQYMDSNFGSFYTRGELCLGDMLESSRVFDDGIKELYEKSNPREHKKIGVLIPLLPYLNKYHNILCNKPLEKELKYIEPLTLREICKVVDYDSSNEDKLKKQLESITVKDTSMVAFISHAKGRFFVVNPSLFYKGNNLDDLTGVINLFKVENITEEN